MLEGKFLNQEIKGEKKVMEQISLYFFSLFSSSLNFLCYPPAVGQDAAHSYFLFALQRKRQP
jgi:hypothetical protein